MCSSKHYLISLASVLILSLYPLYMGIIMLSSYITDSGIKTADYPKYIIPYTPICVSVLLCTLILPLMLKKCRSIASPMISGLGIMFFLVLEVLFESIPVFLGTSNRRVFDEIIRGNLQYRISDAVFEMKDMRYNNALDLHVYIISVLAVVTVLRIIYEICIRNFQEKRDD